MILPRPNVNLLAPSAACALAHQSRETLLQLESSLTREWLLTDGAGAWGSSTVLACPTRRYHGWLVATPRGASKRHLFFARFEESLHGEGHSFPLSLTRYPGLFYPHGHRNIEDFELVPWPSFRYRIGSAEVLRELLLVRRKPEAPPTLLVRYALSRSDRPVELRLRPLLAYREADALTFENIHLDPRVKRSAGHVEVQPYAGLPPLYMGAGVDQARRLSFEADPVWYRRIEYQADLQRGYEGHEDQFSPGLFRAQLEPQSELVMAVSLERPCEAPEAEWERESEQRSSAGARAQARGFAGVLGLGAEDFLVEHPGGRVGVVAGYPWFGEWGRDTYLSLPGLLLARGEHERCRQALESALGFLHQGLLPNIFGTGIADSHYGSADAALWFARAVRLYEHAGGQREFLLDRCLPGLLEIAERLLAGTSLGMQIDERGSLHAGGPELNATWMDAMVRGKPVTARHGCAVELNALWYFLLAYLEVLCHRGRGNAEARRWKSLRLRCGAAFLERFWIADASYLADWWRPLDDLPRGPRVVEHAQGLRDLSVRPNMVLAAALEFSPLSRGKRTDIVSRAQVELVTPRGLRTLAPKNPDYIGRYVGHGEQRDRAYHQGTVWPWLAGFYVEAWLRAFGRRRKGLEELRSWINGFEECTRSQGLLHVSEVFDGDPPHRPGGTIAQAWNTAELLRALQLIEGQNS